jgi:hypothetical protein
MIRAVCATTNVKDVPISSVPPRAVDSFHVAVPASRFNRARDRKKRAEESYMRRSRDSIATRCDRARRK